MDAYIITHIITYLSPANRWGAIVAFGHKKTDEYYHGIITPQDLLKIETYRLEKATPIIVDALTVLPIEMQKQVFMVIIRHNLKHKPQEFIHSREVFSAMMNVSWRDTRSMHFMERMGDRTEVFSYPSWYETYDKYHDMYIRYQYIVELINAGKLKKHHYEAIERHCCAELQYCLGVFDCIIPWQKVRDRRV